MPALPAPRQYRALFSIYIAFLAVVLCAEGTVSLRSRNKWQMGDWLINYSGGFVRRGLAGEVAMRAGHLLHIAPAALVLVVQLTCYAVLLFSIQRMLRHSSWDGWVLLTLFSPATLAFPVLDALGAFRKEILLFAGLGALLLMLRGPVRDTTLALYIALLGVTCVLSHEALLVFLLYLFAALAIGLDSLSRALRISFGPALVILLAAFEVVHHRGDDQIARTICASLGYTFSGALPLPCQGAIAYLGRDQASVRLDVIRYEHQFHYATLYPLVALLAILPIVLAFITLWRRKPLHRQLLIVAATALASIAASSILFFYALDWGRWIYIHIVCISLLLLFIDSPSQPESRSVTIPPQMPVRSVALACGLLLFATCWNLPHVGGYQLHFGYVGLIRLLVHAI